MLISHTQNKLRDKWWCLKISWESRKRVIFAVWTFIHSTDICLLSRTLYPEAFRGEPPWWWVADNRRGSNAIQTAVSWNESDFIFAYVYMYSSSEPFRKERIYIFILLIRLIFSKPNAGIARWGKHWIRLDPSASPNCLANLLALFLSSGIGVGVGTSFLERHLLWPAMTILRCSPFLIFQIHFRRIIPFT